jgi:hypothetical protein
MPRTQRNKGALKNFRFKAKMRRNNTLKNRRKGFYLESLDKERRLEYLQKVAEATLLIAREMERNGEVHPVETCDGSFDTYYTSDDSYKIMRRLSQMTDSPRQIDLLAHREFHRIKRKSPGASFNLKILMAFMALTLVKQTDAKWNEFSSPPGELSAWDTSSAAVVAAGTFVMSYSALAPPLKPVGQGMLACGVVLKAAGSTHRLVDHVRGIHPLTEADATAEALGIIMPGTADMARGMIKFVGPKMGMNVRTERNNPKVGENLVARFGADPSSEAGEMIRFGQNYLEGRLLNSGAPGFFK